MEATGGTMFHRSNGIVLHARRHGDAGRPLLVLANSLGTDARIWDAVLPRLSERYAVLTYDKRGHGLSESPPGPATIADHAADLVGLVEAVGAPRRFALVGLSVGGLIAQMVAARHPDRVAALVLCGTAARIGDAAGWAARIAAVEAEGLAGIADAILERWFTPAYRAAAPDAMAGWRAMLVRQPPEGYVATCAAIRDADLSAQTARLDVPTLCLVGDGDLATPPALVRATADLIPGARFAVLAGAGHLPPIEQPAAMAARVLAHLDEAGFR